MLFLDELNSLKLYLSVQLLLQQVQGLDLYPQPKPQLLISVDSWAWLYSVAKKKDYPGSETCRMPC